MDRARKVKAGQRKGIKSEAHPSPGLPQATWQSVIADAEQQVAELRRTIEWARECARDRLIFQRFGNKSVN